MSDPAFRFGAGARVIRGGLLAVAIVLATMTGHVAGGGSTGSSGSVLLLVPLSFALCVSVADRRRTTPWLLGFCLAVQALFHILLSVMGVHHGHSSALLPSPEMVAGHAVAALLIAAIVRHGDELTRRWVRFLASVARPVAWPGPTAEWMPLAAPAVAPGYSGSTDRSSKALRRGPPSA